MSIESIKRRASAATPEPWGFSQDGSLLCGPDCDLAEFFPTPADSKRDHEQKMRNAKFIAHARADIPLLLRFVEAALARRQEPQYGNDAIHNGAEYERREAEYEAALAALEKAP